MAKIIIFSLLDHILFWVVQIKNIYIFYIISLYIFSISAPLSSIHSGLPYEPPLYSWKFWETHLCYWKIITGISNMGRFFVSINFWFSWVSAEHRVNDGCPPVVMNEYFDVCSVTPVEKWVGTVTRFLSMLVIAHLISQLLRLMMHVMFSFLTIDALQVEIGAATAAPFLSTVTLQPRSRAAVQTAVLQFPPALELDAHQPACDHSLKAHYYFFFPKRVDKHA